VAGQSVLAFFTGSVLAGLIAAFLITYIQTNVKSKEDAAIGVVFSTMFSLGVIGISILTRKEGVHLDLKDFLFGNVLASPHRICGSLRWLRFLWFFPASRFIASYLYRRLIQHWPRLWGFQPK
jgi:ABC-type Mn2+/Zn2+ transport system permease subunit